MQNIMPTDTCKLHKTEPVVEEPVIPETPVEPETPDTPVQPENPTVQPEQPTNPDDTTGNNNSENTGVGGPIYSND